MDKLEIKKEVSQQTLRKFRILKTYLKNLYSTELEYLKEMDGFLDVYGLSKLK